MAKHVKRRSRRITRTPRFRLVAGVAVVVVLAAAGIWLTSSSDRYRVEVRFQTLAHEDLSGSVSFVELRPGNLARNYQVLFGSSLVSTTRVADAESVSPAGVYRNPDPSDPFEDQVLPSTLPPAAPLLAAASATTSFDLEFGGVRILSVHPDSPVSGRIPTGTMLTGISYRSPQESKPTMLPIGDAQRVLDVFAELEPGLEVALLTEIGSISLVWPEERSLGLGVANYMVPSVLPDVEVPAAVVNPAAGLASAIYLADMIAPADLLSGRRVAAFGRITEKGAVLPLDNPNLRRGAVPSDVDVLFVHSSQVSHYSNTGVEVVGVDSLDDVIAALQGN